MSKIENVFIVAGNNSDEIEGVYTSKYMADAAAFRCNTSASEGETRYVVRTMRLTRGEMSLSEAQETVRCYDQHRAQKLAARERTNTLIARRRARAAAQA